MEQRRVDLIFFFLQLNPRQPPKRAAFILKNMNDNKSLTLSGEDLLVFLYIDKWIHEDKAVLSMCCLHGEELL